jgi:hypothetical protein
MWVDIESSSSKGSIANYQAFKTVRENMSDIIVSQIQALEHYSGRRKTLRP